MLAIARSINEGYNAAAKKAPSKARMRLIKRAVLHSAVLLKMSSTSASAPSNSSSSVFWRRYDVTSCTCPSLKYTHVHCPRERCEGKAVSRAVEYRHWTAAKELSVPSRFEVDFSPNPVTGAAQVELAHTNSTDHDYDQLPEEDDSAIYTACTSTSTTAVQPIASTMDHQAALQIVQILRTMWFGVLWRLCNSSMIQILPNRNLLTSSILAKRPTENP